MPQFNPIPVPLPPDPITTGVTDTGLGQYINHVTNGVPVPEPSALLVMTLGTAIFIALLAWDKYNHPNNY